ncbi:hypothetical protein ACLB2K_027799 [Fragaria x ananassa]
MEEHAPRFNLSIVSSDVEVGGARLSAEYALSDEEIAIAHWWVLINCEEVKYWKELHLSFPEVDGDLEYHNMTFVNYFRTWMDMIKSDDNPNWSHELLLLAMQPQRARVYPTCTVNGVKFVSEERDNGRRTQNSGVMAKGHGLDYYRVLHSVVELVYAEGMKVHLFKCRWFDTGAQSMKMDQYGNLSVNTATSAYEDDPDPSDRSSRLPQMPSKAPYGDECVRVTEDHSRQRRRVGLQPRPRVAAKFGVEQHVHVARGPQEKERRLRLWYTQGFGRDIKKATCDFTTAIGHGAFGPVYKAQMSTGETFAVKVLASDSRQGQHEFLAEVLLLARLHHNNLVSLMGYTAEMDQLMLLYNYMNSGSLDSHLHADNQVPLSWDLRVAIALDVARGLEYLHYGIADFGLSRQDKMKSRLSDIRGTVGYVDPDPEYVVTRIFTKKCNVYSFGVLLFELITGRNPQQGLMEYVEFATMDAADSLAWEEIVDLRLNGEFDVQEVAQVADLAYKCVGNVSKKRPSMREIVQTL